MTPETRLHAAAAVAAALLALQAPVATAAQEPTPRPDAARRGAGPADTSAAPGAIGPLVHVDRTDDAPELVLYPGGDALVRERIRFDLDAGRNTLSWPDPPDALDPTSLSLTFPDGADPEVLSSLHRPAAAGVGDALRGLVGRVVEVDTDDGRRLVGRLISARDALVLDTGAAPAETDGGDGDRADDARDIVLLTAGQVRGYRLRELPGTFRTGPGVEWTVRAGGPGRREAEVAYLSGGLSWDAHHVVELGRGEETADVAAWAELENGTDRTFRDAAVKLVAGDVQRVGDGRRGAARVMEAAAAVRMDDAGDGGAVERAFGELRLFELPRPTTLPAGAAVQPLLFRAADVPVRKELVVVGGPDRPYRGSGPSLSPDVGAEETTEHARVRYLLSTAEDGGVGHDLPAGRVRVYREDEDGTLLLAGEDRVGNVPRGDTARIETGRSFRVTRTRIQTAFRRPDARTMEEGFRLELRNDREEPVELRVVERMHRWDEWEVVEARLDGEPADPRRLDVRTVDWRVSLPAGSERELTYTVRYTLPPDPDRVR